MAKKRKWGSPAQRAAFKKMLAARKSSAKKAKAPRPKRPSRRKRKALGPGKHRPVVIRKSGKLYRPRRSTLPKHATFANPFLGGLAMVGNPRRKRRKSAAARKHRRSSRRRSFALCNPLPSVLAAPRQMASKDFITEAASVAAGFVLPNVILPRLPVAFRDSTVKAYAAKVVVVAGLAGVASAVSKRVSRAILLGGGVSILLDVWTDFVAPAVMKAGGVSAFYGEPGDPGVGTFYGEPGDPGVGSSIGDAFGGDGEAWG